MESTEKALLEKIREARFACIELRIYLDTHPDDAIAQADYLAYSENCSFSSQSMNHSTDL